MSRFGLFSAGALSFAIPLLQIKKILQDSRPFALPCLPATVTGVLVDEDRLVPVLDVGLLHDNGTCSEKSYLYHVLVESEYGTLALPADLSVRIVSEQKGTITTALKEYPPWVVGIFYCQEMKHFILNIDFLAIEMTQGFWRSTSEADAARRHQ